MGLAVSAEGGKDFEVLPNGLYVARCYRLIDLGTQWVEWQGKKKEQKKVSVSWEILDEPKMKDGRPFSVHKTYTASLNEKARLRADLESWRNKDFTEEELENFDLKSVLGAYCQIQVAKDESGKYSNIQSIVAMKGDKPKPVNENVIFDMDNPDMDTFNKLSDTMKEKIEAAPEFRIATAEKEEVKEPETPAKPDKVITDFNEEEPINLDDIPF